MFSHGSPNPVTSHHEPISASNTSKAMVVGTVLAIAAYGLSFLYAHFLNFYLHAQAYGQYAAIVSGLNILSTVILLGSEVTLINFVSNYISNESWHKVKGYLYFFSRLTAVIAMIFISIAAITIIWDSYHHSSLIEIYLHKHLIFKYFWFSAFMALTLFWVKLLTVLGHPLQTQIFLDFGCVLVQMLFLLVLVSLGVELNIGLSVLAFALGYVFTALGIAIALKRAIPKQLKEAITDLSDKKQWFAIAVKTFLASFFFVNIPSILIVINKIFDKNPINTGALAIIVVISGAIWLPYPIISRLFGPKIRPDLEAHRYQLIQRYVNLGNLYLFICCSLFYGIFLLWGRHILGYFNSEYVAIFNQAKFYLFFTCLTVMGCMVRNIMIYSGQVNTIVGIAGICCFVLAVFGSILIDIDGLWGACIAYAVVQMIAFVFPCLYVYKTYGISMYRLGIKSYEQN